MKAQEQAAPAYQRWAGREEGWPDWSGTICSSSGKKEGVSPLEKGEETQGEFKDIVRSSRKKIKEAKANLEFNLATSEMCF